ncbi:MAG: ABC transporter permease [Lachnospiraceae bacterium]|nr:ABC transporter permease [Lachnospiraceae bacterium]
MRILDLLRMSLSSLWKRKIRTVLTILGVVIGTASIVVMISLGLGLKKSSMDRIEEYGGLTTIEVYEGNNYSNGAVAVSSGSSQETLRLDDDVVKQLSGLEHVESVYPLLRVNAIAKYGRYEGYFNIQGMPIEGIKSLRIEVGEGHLPESSTELEFFFGNQVAADFYDPKTYDYPYWSTGEYPVDLMEDTVFTIFDREAYWNSQNQDMSSGQSTQPPKKYIIKTAGVEKPNEENSWSQYGYNVYCNIEVLKPFLQRVFKNKVIPGQPTTQAGKPYKEIFYNQLYVNVDSIDHVTAVQEQIQSLGYQTYSNAEWVEATQKEYASTQAVLGGIGAVSMLVAAISIANTMMMSIYERTKEIGVMKVLGCDMRNIQAMFLVEAGYIGLIGGIAGLAVSYGISVIINRISEASGNIANLSYIPAWLAGMSVIFAVVIGMLAGFFPSRRAMKLSPLAAIRNE